MLAWSTPERSRELSGVVSDLMNGSMGAATSDSARATDAMGPPFQSPLKAERRDDVRRPSCHLGNGRVALGDRVVAATSAAPPESPASDDDQPRSSEHAARLDLERISSRGELRDRA